MKDFFMGIWDALVEFYNAYSSFVHSILPGGIGDYVVALLDLAICVMIVWIVAKSAFGTKGN